MTAGRLFCFGLGYSAGFLGRALFAQGWSVAGTSREEAGRARPDGESFALEVFARAQPLADPAATLAGASHVLVSIPPDAEGDPVCDLYGDRLARLPDLRWLGYLSTTGVYGDRGGAWVDESSPLLPSGERGRRRVAAETAWLDLYRRHRLPVHVFRLAGIYGAGRSALDALREGRAQRIDKPGQVFSRIHVADLVACLLSSMARPNPGAIYNLCDDDPAPPEAVVDYAARLIGVMPPPLLPFDQAALSPMARSFYDDNKRVSNRRLKEELGVTLIYPSYRDGLAALLREEDGAKS
jgi:nucleoside-diphosphate-sugar epimerase